MVLRGELPVVRIGPQLVRYRPEDLEALMLPEYASSPARQPSSTKTIPTQADGLDEA